jgi:TonB-dependent SusC/RagA subfamily outer membrane receptor
MFKKIHVLFLFGLLLSTSVLAQTGSITGTVLDAKSGEPIPSATVQIVELQRGTATDIDGNYSITNLPTGSYTLRASFVGYQVFETPVNIGSGETQLSIELDQDLLGLDALVVTAFGVTREEKSLGYSVQSVSGEAVTMVDDANIVGALSGKVAGVQVIGAAGGNLGGSEKIRIRGTNGLGDGQPLFVVDGTPIDNRSFSSYDGGRDFGNLASDLNLQDVSDVSVLKGAAASVLYGNRASNGVILITTKKGRKGADQPLQVDFSNTTSFEKVYILSDYQNEYGGGYSQSYIPYTADASKRLYDDGNGNFFEDRNLTTPYTGTQAVHNTLNYAADESWGPKMDGTMYRPWWSWYHNDWDGDGVDD